MTQPYESILVERSGGRATITLNRPDALNAFTSDMAAELQAAVDDVATDPDVRAVLITGAGRAFSAGADVKGMRRTLPNGDPDLAYVLRDHYNPLIAQIRRAPKPFIAAVNGPAAGVGCSLALSCDLILAAESAYLLLAFIRIGLGPDGGASWFLTQRVGAIRATELMMLGEKLPAPKALEWGLVNAVHPDDELGEAARALADRLAAAPTVALATVKQATNAAAHAGLEAHLALEADLQQRHATTADYREGVAAFREKRPAQFTGA